MSEPIANGAEKKVEAAVVAGRGAIFIGFAKIYFMMTGFVQRVLLTRLIGPSEFGDFAVVNNVVSIVNNTVVQGTVQSVSKFTAEDDARAGAVQRAGLKLQAGLGLALGALFFLAAPFIADFYNAPRYTPYFRIAALIPFLYAVYAVFVGSANGLRRFRTQAGFDVTFSTAKTILLLGLAALWQVTGAFLGFVLAAVFILIVASRVIDLRGASGGGPFPVKRLAAYMSAVVTYTLLLNLALNYDLPLLRYFAGASGALGSEQASAVAGHYEALRTFALLPYQALLVVTFVIFPLVSKSTFAEDREATRAYVTQTLRIALILAGGMAIVLAARPEALFGVIYKPEYRDGAPALPILVAGECCLALLGVGCAILNAAGRPRASLALMSLTVVVGSLAIGILAPRAAPGAPMLLAAATGSAIGMATGLGAATLYLRTRLGGAPPLATVLRVGAALLAAVIGTRLIPGKGKILGLMVMALSAAIYAAVLVLTREFKADDLAKVAKIVRRRR